MVLLFLSDPMGNAIEFTLHVFDSPPYLLLLPGIHLRQSFGELVAETAEDDRCRLKVPLQCGNGLCRSALCSLRLQK
jgi:hypothetical protein